MINKETYNLFLKLDRDKRVEAFRGMLSYNAFLKKNNFTQKLNNERIEGYSSVRRGIGILKERDNSVKYIYFQEKKKNEINEKVLVYEQLNNKSLEKYSPIDLKEYINKLEFINDSLFIAFFK